MTTTADTRVGIVAHNTLIELARTCPDICLTVRAGDLLEAMEYLLGEAMNRPEDSELVTRGQAAEICHVDLSTLNRWEKSGYLTPVRIGRRVMYRTGDIREAINRGKKI